MRFVSLAVLMHGAFQNIVASLMNSCFPLIAYIFRQWVDGWMTCEFTPFLTVFQSYQDDVGMIRKGCVQWNSRLRLGSG